MVKRTSRLPKVLLGLLAAAILIFTFLPLYSAIIVSLTPYSNMLEPMIYPKYFEISNYGLVFRYIFRPMMNSFSYSLIAVVIVLCISIPSAYVLSRFRFRGRKPMMFILLFTQMLSGIVLMPAIYNLFVSLGLVNSLPALLFVYVGVNLSLSVWLLISFIDAVPIEIEEAAIIDGAGRLRLIYGIALPIIKPGIAVSAIFIFVNTYNEFVIPLFLVNNAKYQPVTMILNSLLTANTVEYHMLAAGAIIAMVPALVIFLVFQKSIISGAAAGAVKG